MNGPARDNNQNENTGHHSNDNANGDIDERNKLHLVNIDGHDNGKVTGSKENGIDLSNFLSFNSKYAKKTDF